MVPAALRTTVIIEIRTLFAPTGYLDTQMASGSKDLLQRREDFDYAAALNAFS